MLRLWDESIKGESEAGRGRSLSAPLVPLLRRFQFLQPLKSHNHPDSTPFLPNGAPYSPNECLLRFLKIPANDDVAVDLRQTAVVIMAHLGKEGVVLEALVLSSLFSLCHCLERSRMMKKASSLLYVPAYILYSLFLSSLPPFSLLSIHPFFPSSTLSLIPPPFLFSLYAFISPFLLSYLPPFPFAFLPFPQTASPVSICPLVSAISIITRCPLPASLKSFSRGENSVGPGFAIPCP